MNQQNKFDGYYKTGNYNISELCLETYPCKHYVMDCDGGNCRLLKGDEIYRLLKKDGIQNDPHFKMYEEGYSLKGYFNFLRAGEHMQTIAELREEQKKRDDKILAENEIINKFKASSRIEKLKNNLNNPYAGVT